MLNYQVFCRTFTQLLCMKLRDRQLSVSGRCVYRVGRAVEPGSLVHRYWRFGGNYSILKMETAAGFFETFVTTYENTRRHNWEDQTVNLYTCKDPKTHSTCDRS